MTKPLVSRSESDAVFHQDSHEEEPAMDENAVVEKIAIGTGDRADEELNDAEYIPLKNENLNKSSNMSSSQEIANGVSQLSLSGHEPTTDNQDNNRRSATNNSKHVSDDPVMSEDDWEPNSTDCNRSVDSYRACGNDAQTDSHAIFSRGMPVPPLDLGSLISTGSSVESINEITHHEIDFLRSKVRKLQEENEKLTNVVAYQEEKIQMLESKVREFEENKRTVQDD
uniref:Uncharacterized protein LOC102809958 n=1 Tax=Saccoglossus kowalevskii TaxID=10224 RepID=A0ABM0MUR3_SACKO|nr:PREDICTED: uncharacterized protein LOC102809958 [Saccoglossus kowalevskii]